MSFTIRFSCKRFLASLTCIIPLPFMSSVISLHKLMKLMLNKHEKQRKIMSLNNHFLSFNLT